MFACLLFFNLSFVKKGEGAALQEGSSELLFKLGSAAMALAPGARGAAFALLARHSARMRSVGLACAAARACDEVLQVLVACNARLLEEELRVQSLKKHDFFFLKPLSRYSQMLMQLPPGTFIEMLRSILRFSETVELLDVAPSRLLQDAVLAGSPELCSLLLSRGCRCE